MSDNSNNNNFWYNLCDRLVILIVILVLGTVFLTFTHIEKMAELGYQETTIVGNEHPVWQKIK